MTPASPPNSSPYAAPPVSVPDQLLNATEVAKLYGITRATAWKWARIGKIPPPLRAFGGKWRMSDIQKHIASLEHAQLQEALS